MKIDFANLQCAYQEHKSEIDQAINKVILRNAYIMGEEVKLLERALEKYLGVNHAMTCSSGTDALLLAMMAIGIKPGDEVITTPFTFIATAETIAFLGAKPVFIDIDEETYNIDVTKIEEKINYKTKAIIPVSLYGQPADMDVINVIAEKNNIHVIEDAAQSFGATYNGKKSGNLSDIGCTSFFPAKPLGCFGDGGAVFSNNKQFADKIVSLREHGKSKRYHHQYIGLGARMDTLQAAILLVKIKHYNADLKRRQEVAAKYDELINTSNLVKSPIVRESSSSAWAQYSIRVKNRGSVQQLLKDKGIPTAIHYPKPLHLQECFHYLNEKEGSYPIAEKVSQEIISLPMNPYLLFEEQQFIVNELNQAINSNDFC